MIRNADKEVVGSRKRMLICGVVLMAVVVVTVAFMVASNLAFSLFDRLQSWSPWVAGAYVVLLVAAASGLVIWRLLSPTAANRTMTEAPKSEGRLRMLLARHGQRGVEIGADREALREHERRGEAGEIYLALFGEISYGKTSLIRALVPGVEGAVDVRGRSNTKVRHYAWTAPSGDRMILADVPGMHLTGEQRLVSAMEEALRAHITIFVCDGELTTDHWSTLLELKRYGKSMVVAINNLDRLSPLDMKLVRNRIAERIGAGPPVVTFRSGGTEKVIRVFPDGSEERVERERKSEIDALVVALQGLLMEQSAGLSRLRDNTIFLLATGKPAETLGSYREQTATMLVERFTRRAVIGKRTAIAAGSDPLIQDALGAALTRSLTRLYDIRVHQVDLDALLKAASKTVATRLPRLLVVAGDALRAFPKIGALAEGLAHAVADGLIFQSLGKALSKILKEDGTLRQNRIIEAFAEDLNGNLAVRAKELTLMALSRKRARSESRG